MEPHGQFRQLFLGSLVMLLGHYAVGQADEGGGAPTISYIGGVSDVYTSTADTLSLALPSGWAAGDLGVLSFVQRGNDTLHTDPSGWTQIATATQATTSAGVRMTVWARVLQGGDTDPGIGNSGGVSNTGAGRLDVFRASSGAIAATADATGTGSGTAVTFPTLDATSTGEAVLLLCGTGADSASGQLSGSVTHSGLTGLSAVDEDNVSTSTGSGRGVFGAYGAPGATGATGTGAATLVASQSWAAVSVLVGVTT